ncbi:hypothetical protein B0F90DRAFT_1810632 [Multifurca ochricompacta]|uniref:Sacsin/Nov domain-containing protein n=1 Tax=Multifurca ochricompacta TaxID=376703 RepID=A0AAD4M236_9AGAM|nr:hypothetical protein B0F90DRAFT_1810632 [Multifurca ochricompacta]
MSPMSPFWATGHDETVEVNQRALIDKVLARYSGEFTVFRELLQNSDDAGAHSVEICFETESYLSQEKREDNQLYEPKQEDLPDLKTAVVHQWTFKNNGIPFRDEDWSRLKKIAEGNPDEEKIGAFGVGFYSLFSVTEEPWVTSGGQWMNFYWKDKKDQLFARRGTVPSSKDEATDPWTTFQMVLREPGPMPPAFDFTRFLVSSITFMTHLSEVSVYFDDKRLVRLSKVGDVPKDVPMLKGLKSTSPDGMMTVKSIETMSLHIEAEVVRWVYTVGSEKFSAASRTDTLKAVSHQASGFFSSLFAGFGGSSTQRRTPTPVPAMPKESTNLLEIHSSSVVLTIFTANVDVRLNKKMTAELLRSTKKNPPSRLRYELIYTGKDEYDASVKAEEKAAFAAGSVFQGLRADLEGTGSARVFIGHSTGQTTGIGGHMATRFIPTVERESIDLVDRNVAVWNKELLYVGGFLARFAYELELDVIKNKWEGAAVPDGPDGLPDAELQTWLREHALHALKFFTFHPSTPSAVVSSLMVNAFFACATTRPFPIISSEGVRSASLVHIPDPDSLDILKGANTMVATLRDRRMIKDITFVDVLNELRARPLSEAETVACLKWWVGVSKQGNNPSLLQGRSQLLDALVVSIVGPPEKIMKLSEARTFLNSRTGGAIIPTDGPLPSTLLPTSITRSFDPDILGSVFPWQQLTIVDWLGHVTDPKVAAGNAEHDITLSPSWAERVLSVLARSWPSLSKSAQEDVVRILGPKPCIPTSTGLKIPDQAYFASVNLFRDLPIVTMPSESVIKGTLEKVLQSLGVRKHVELQIVFDRMIKTGDWTTFDLVKYLVSIQSTLTPQELERLRHTSAFSKQGASNEQLALGTGRKIQRYKAMDLYEPVDIFRELCLPIIDWGADNRWKPSSDEAKFLFSLGLMRAPSLSEILKIAASGNPTVRGKALTFFLDNISLKYPNYDPYDYRDLAFVPAVRGSEEMLAKPFELYSGSEWAALGFSVVNPSLHQGAASKLKLNDHPPTSELVILLEKSPPGDEAMARQWFEVLSGRVPDFSPAELRKLSETPFVPVRSTGDKSTTRMLQPIQCYFSGTGGVELHSKLFAFVDFGVRANVFLTACGTKQEPSVEEIAQILLENPQQFYQLANGRENYLFELRNLAVNRRLLTKGTILRMKRSNILLGSRRVKSGVKASNEGDEENWDFQDDLLQPNKVAVADDTNAYQLFSDRIFCAPQEDILEGLYLFLGSPPLSSLVREDYRTAREVFHSKTGAETKHLILERLPLFLHEFPQSRTKVSFNWLNEEKNFIVKVFGKLQVTKSLQHGDLRYSESSEASAVAKREGRGPIELWLAENTQVDMYEVSTSLCRFIFESPKLNDALLFMTILSTDLKALKRRGYNVDRILRQQKAEREAVEKLLRAETRATLVSSPAMTAQEIQTKTPTTQPKIPSTPIGPTIAAPAPRTGPSPEQVLKRPTSAINNLGRFLRPNRSDTSSPQSTSPPPRESVLQPSPGPGPSRALVRSPQPGPNVTPLANIANNIDMAIRACAPERSNLLRNREEMQVVKESLDEGYCDVSGRAGDLDLVGTMGGVKVFATQDLPERDTLIHRKHDVLARFLYVLNPLVAVYKIPQACLHVFADKEGQLVAFNRGGSLFMNLRYYEAWHDHDVQRGDFNKAFISWYFTLAHEIAHNLVHPHNSEHEFYFSAICEAYFVPLSRLLPHS